MQSLRYLYKIGHGPSSSHTMGPAYAAEVMKSRYLNATQFKTILYGSLALTGKGHLTDTVLINTFKPYFCEVIFDYLTECQYHPNTLDILAYDGNGLLASVRFYSIGGGSIEIAGEGKYSEPVIYQEKSFTEIKHFLEVNQLSLCDYVIMHEGIAIKEYLKTIYEQMKKSIASGLNKTGVLPGELGVLRKAKTINEKMISDASLTLSKKVFSYAYAVSEENASGGLIVTAPTCGSSGVLPSVLYGLQESEGFSDDKIIEALMVAGIIGNLIKSNASISGAEAGCQAEIGTACAMAAAACAYLLGSNIDELEQAAEIALEHHLGLTCDPIKGYVQIPCIERNAVCALRAIDSAKLVSFIDSSSNKISFDLVVKTMLETGKDLKENYRETAMGGLAKEYRK